MSNPTPLGDMKPGDLAAALTWRGRAFSVAVTRYLSNDNLCLVLLSANGDVEYKATVNVGALPDGAMYIKNYSENAGILAILVARGFIRDTGQFIRNGSVAFHLCEVTQKLADLTGCPMLPKVEPFKPVYDEPQSIAATVIVDPSDPLEPPAPVDPPKANDPPFPTPPKKRKSRAKKANK